MNKKITWQNYLTSKISKPLYLTIGLAHRHVCSLTFFSFACLIESSPNMQWVVGDISH